MSAAAHRALPVPEGLAGERLDSALARLFGVSRTRAAELIEAGHVRLDGATPLKSERLSAGEWLEVDLPAGPGETAPEPLSEGAGPRIIFEDDDILVVDKPAGIAAHPSPGWSGPTVVGQLAAIGTVLALGGAAERQGVVHRLDVGTSGVMVLARSERAYSMLKRAFRAREVDKTYHALVQGHPDPSRGTVDAPIDRHPRHDARWAVVAGGRPSITHYETLEAHRYASLLRVGLETGRTHQIRVHMSALHHPCVGDLTYGADPVLAERVGLRRQGLHAVSLRLRHPASGEAVEYSAPYPDDLAQALEAVRAAA
ncbi:MAG TPA: RluA family pseudouridine synthase [Nocardioidaceae bacterium]|jgi:23S rRNA pseudouridine1911/1915/1917 synthase|nr:RluA family pseudouridine synthase [Nocardioidaceae bacterium]